MAERLEFSVSETERKFARENPWFSFVIETAQGLNGEKYQRRRGSQIIYQEFGEGFKCVECDSDIKGGLVAHKVLGLPFLIGNEKEYYIGIMPYCPECEDEPDFYGSSIQFH